MNLTNLQVALFEPRIPQNTGNIARTSAAFNIPLNLIQPLGFSLESRYLKRAGLDYWPLVNLTVHSNFSEFNKSMNSHSRIIGFSKSGQLSLQSIEFKKGDILLFGREDTGLPKYVRSSCQLVSSIPMPGGAYNNNQIGVRSLNLSSAVAIVLYQACLKLELI